MNMNILDGVVKDNILTSKSEVVDTCWYIGSTNVYHGHELISLIKMTVISGTRWSVFFITNTTLEHKAQKGWNSAKSIQIAWLLYLASRNWFGDANRKLA